MKKLQIIFVLMLFSLISFSQQEIVTKKLKVKETALIGEGTLSNAAIFEIISTDKGALLPRMNSTQRDNLTVADGLIIYNTSTNLYQFHNGTDWVDFGGGAGGSGDVSSSIGSSTDNNVAVFDGATGKIIKESPVSVTVGGAIEGAEIDGATNTITNVGFAAFDTDVSATMEFAVGAYLDVPAVTVTSNGSITSLNVEQSGGGDIRVIFSTGVYVFDATPIQSIALTSGTDVSPTLNYIYILESTKLLTVSTTGWPAAEFSAVATVVCQSAASIQTIGAYKVHSWTDHMGNGNGHLHHINKWIRDQPATWLSGVDWTLNINTTPSPDDMYMTNNAGVVLQLHEHVFPAFTDTTTFDYLFVNHPTPYTKSNSIGTILVDAAGGSLSGRFYTYVIWGVVSEDTGDCHLMINLPTGSYGTSSAALADADGFTVYDAHSDYTGTSFLIAEITAQHASGGGGTFTSIRETDLRGKSPGAVSGGGGTATTNFQDDQFTIYDNIDPTKVANFELSGISTGTTRTLTVPDKSGTIALLSDISVGGGDITHNTTLSAGILTNIGLYGFAPVYSNGATVTASTTTDNTVLHHFYVEGISGAAIILGAGTRQVTATFAYVVGTTYYLDDAGALATSADSDGDAIDYDSAVVYVIADLGSNVYILNYKEPRHFVN